MLTLTNFKVEDCDLSDDTLCRYLATSAIAVDTETMGLIPQRDRLCLIQLCDSDGFVTAIRIGIGQT
ncbi:MAG: ribonuclease D, partial [cyanobacterium endosymbiont of Rhopalodia fuxianensis]